MSDYIMDLRKTVGHRPLLQVGASVIVEDKCGHILLQLRSDNQCWGYSGGSVELDEIVEEAAKDEVSNIDIVFICKKYSGRLKCQKGEVDDLKFFPADNLPENISKPVINAIRKWADTKR